MAERVEAVMPSEGITPGYRECHDAQPGHLRVDFVYPNAMPRPFALEITMLTLGEHRAGVSAADALTDSLSKIAERERLGAWLVTVRTIGTNLRSLEAEIIKVLRSAQRVREKLLREDEQIRPGHYTSDELLALPNEEARRQFAAEHKRLKEMGLEEVKPVVGGREHVVGVLPLTGWFDIGPFTDELQQAVNDNAEKLGEAEGLEHHLAVLVDRFDASTYPGLTDLPDFPPELHLLWVVHRWRHGETWRAVWVARAADVSWRVHGHE